MCERERERERERDERSWPRLIDIFVRPICTLRAIKTHLNRMILTQDLWSLIDQKINIIFTCMERLRARVAVMIVILEP